MYQSVRNPPVASKRPPVRGGNHACVYPCPVTRVGCNRMPPTTAILFPGQGSQTPEMRELVQRERPDLLELAAEIVGEDPFPRADDGTNFAQPAIYCASLAGWSA